MTCVAPDRCIACDKRVDLSLDADVEVACLGDSAIPQWLLCRSCVDAGARFERTPLGTWWILGAGDPTPCYRRRTLNAIERTKPPCA